MRILIALTGLSLVWAGGCRSGASADSGAKLWVAAYYYPNGPGLDEWNHLIASARRAPIVAIVNPNSGPGYHQDSNYATVIPRARKAGLTLVGYISTQYTKKPLAQVEEEVETYLRFYPEIQGIHVDEQSTDAASVGYYTDLYKYIRRRIPNALVINNPGTPCAEEYISRPACDVVCLFENAKGFDTFRPPTWTTRFQASRFGIQSYGVSTESEMKRQVQEAERKRFGYVFVTDATLPNPYDRLPVYWDAEVDVVQQVNHAAHK